MSEIAKIRQEVWETLDFQEKMNVAQAIANCEGNYLGIPQMMTVHGMGICCNAISHAEIVHITIFFGKGIFG